MAAAEVTSDDRMTYISDRHDVYKQSENDGENVFSGCNLKSHFAVVVVVVVVVVGGRD